MTQLHYDHSDTNFSIGSGENQLREDLADAMRESSGSAMEGGKCEHFFIVLPFFCLVLRILFNSN